MSAARRLRKPLGRGTPDAMIDRRQLLAASLALPLASAAAAQDDWAHPTPAAGAPDRPAWPPAEHFSLWPGSPPGTPAAPPTPNDTMNGPTGQRQLWLRGIAEPVVGVYRPAHPDGRALLSIPGGGYGFVSVQLEGIEVARRFNAEGITVFVLAYRLPGEGWAHRADVPLQDAQRAMRLIRARARSFAVDPARLAAIGFSAGGHLAAMLATAFDDRVYAPVDAADRQSARPAATGLAYPVITPETHGNGGTFEQLFGPSPDAATVARYTASSRVTAATPPLFMVQALDDGLVQPENTLAMLAAARAAKVPCEAHLFEGGGHGFGLATGRAGSTPLWPDLFSRWLGTHVRA